jgi:hypothetical protein
VSLIDLRTEQMDSKLDAVLALVGAEKGVPRKALKEILFEFGEVDVPEGNIEQRLRLKAQEYRLLIDQSRSANPEHSVSIAVIEQLSKLQAVVLAEEAQSDIEQADYLAAAQKYRQAAELLAFDQVGNSMFFQLAAHALHLQGTLVGDNGSLRDEITIWRGLVETSGAGPRAFMSVKLGLALFALGSREDGTTLLAEASAAFRNAVTEAFRRCEPLLWASAQFHLGLALSMSGVRAEETEPLTEAVTAFSQAHLEQTKVIDPVKWVFIQGALAHTLAVIAQRTNSLSTLKESIEAVNEALEVIRTGVVQCAIVEQAQSLILQVLRDQHGLEVESINDRLTIRQRFQ